MLFRGTITLFCTLLYTLKHNAIFLSEMLYQYSMHYALKRLKVCINVIKKQTNKN